jgi:hypothetical protein
MSRLLSINGLAAPEVGFEEIAIDVLQARFWNISGWPTIRPELSASSAMG